MITYYDQVEFIPKIQEWFSIHSIRSPSHSNQIKQGIQTGKEEVELSLFADAMIFHIENPKVFTLKLIESINEFSEVERYKINIQTCHFSTD